LVNNNNIRLFNLIAPAYGLYYKSQKKRYLKVLDDIKDELDITRYQKIIDIGCGTGALCSVLNQKGLSVTGVDTAQKMLKIARNNSKNTNINFIEANVLNRLPFEDKYFDISIASYVAHGLQEHERILMYSEMNRITKHRVIICDYNRNRSILTTIAEWMEKGDYFHFIKNAELEMKNCEVKKKKCFFEVKVINVDVQAAWYICTPA
jgi:ubiquinone/menaquinone biosynthesis C-methylase UbiE